MFIVFLQSFHYACLLGPALLFGGGEYIGQNFKKLVVFFKIITIQLVFRLESQYSVGSKLKSYFLHEINFTDTYFA